MTSRGVMTGLAAGVILAAAALVLAVAGGLVSVRFHSNSEGGKTMKKIIRSEKAPAAIGPYSQAIQAGGLVFVSGQIPLDLEGKIVEGGIEEQTVQVLENLKAVLAAAGLGLGEVVRTTVYLQDLKDFNAFNEIYGRYFPDRPPARACVEVSALPRGARVEVTAVAARSDFSAFDFQ